MSILIAILAHNEESRIGSCIASLLSEPGDFLIHVVVNGTSDRTAEIASSFGHRIIVHNYTQGGKSRSWNRFVFEELGEYADTHVFVDGDAEIAPGSVAALQAVLEQNPSANAASGVPLNGRRAEYYQSKMRIEHGLFGDLYAVRGSFLARMKAANIRLPDDLVGDDGLIGSLAKTDLNPETEWQDNRVIVSRDAGFYCEPASIADPATWKVQYARQINYSVRHFQNQIISDIMRAKGPNALPAMLSRSYPYYLKSFRPRFALSQFWFDFRALRRMHNAAQKLSA
jgi:glycosyltransferase involved in cell wall biosynthesis